MVHLLIYLQGDLLVCDVIGRYGICKVLLVDACFGLGFVETIPSPTMSEYTVIHV